MALKEKMEKDFSLIVLNGDETTKFLKLSYSDLKNKEKKFIHNSDNHFDLLKELVFCLNDSLINSEDWVYICNNKEQSIEIFFE